MQSLCFKRLISLSIVVATCVTGLFAQTYNDGPIQLQVRVRDISTNFTATDVNFPGIGLPDELTYKVWARDNTTVVWQGGQCLTSNFNPPGNSPDFNYTALNITYPGAPVPQTFDIRGDFWEDDSDDATCQGSRCTFESNVGCACTPFGCLYNQEDDEHCDANPFKTNMDYRLGPPCQWFDHGYVTGACGNKYKPRIESYWRYTRGTDCNNTIVLGTLPSGGSLTHFNSNECYANNFSASPGKDVFYQFTISAPTGVLISLCGGTSFNTVLYLVDASCTQISMNDNSCGIVSEIKANLCTPGTYKVIVDGANANSQGTFTLLINDDPSALISVNVTGTDALCNSGNTGTATANVLNGTAPFTYTWNPNVGTTPTVTGLSGGVTYSVTVNDNTGCSATGSVTIGQPSSITFTTVVTDPMCNGGNTGSIVVTASGGSGTYQYSKDGGNIYQNNNAFTGVGAGTYNVVVKDVNNCTTQNTVIVTEPIAIEPNLTTTNISCNGANDGSVTSNPTNGSPPYTYSLDSGPFVSTNTFPGISITGLHILTVKDADNCTASEPFLISEPSNLTIVFPSGTVISPSCNGQADGSFLATGSGGSPPYEFSLDDISYQSSGMFGGLTAATYNVYVRDTNGCKSMNSITINEPGLLTATDLFRINISCNGSTDGTVVLTASGGSAPYEFSKDHFFYTTSGFFDRLAGGTYTYYVRDANNCEDSVTFTIAEPDTLKVTPANVTNATCLGITDGSITVHAEGGTPPYKFSLNGGAFQNDSVFSSLTAGNYDFTVRDDNFCEETQTLTIGFNTTISAITSQQNITCSGAGTGEITVTASNGQTPYTYSLDGTSFQVSNVFTGLSAGNYTVTTKDSAGCLAINMVTITQPGPLVITLVKTTPAKCFNTADGSAEIDVQGGDVPYTFLWSNGNMTQNLVNVLGGDYTVTVSDANTCTATFNVTIGQSPGIFIGIEHFQNVSCNGDEDGVINISVNGGTPGYVYRWSNGKTTEDLVNIGPGSYRITITDANNCSLEFDTVISSPSGLFVAVDTVSNATCANGNDGSITVAASGGTNPLGYSVDGFTFQSSPVFTGLQAGIYPVVVKDDNDCVKSTSATINDGNDIFFSYGGDKEMVNGQSIQLIPILVPDNLPIGSVRWEPTTGLSNPDTISPIASPTETTVYTVTLSDENGCVAEAVVRIVVTDDWQIFLPNIFTPNGDQNNDYFDYYAYGVSNVEVKVFNRWGAKVYYNENQALGEGNGWDGMYNGKEAQQGAYMYLINVLFTNNEERQKTGTITLVR